MPPLGDIPSTLLALFIGNPDISWMYTHKRNGKEFSVGNRELSEALGGGTPFLILPWPWESRIIFGRI